MLFEYICYSIPALHFDPVLPLNCFCVSDVLYVAYFYCYVA